MKKGFRVDDKKQTLTMDLPVVGTAETPLLDFNRLRHRMRYAPFVLVMNVPEWKAYVYPIRMVSLN